MNKQIIQIPYGFEFRDYQKNLWVQSFQKKRLVYVWHRRAGKDIFAINRLLYAMLFEQVGTYWHIFPRYNQAKRSVWQERDASGKRYLDYIPKEVIEKTNETELKVTLKNGSIYQFVGSDNPDNLRGAGIKGVCFSEYAEQDSRIWDIIQPMINATNGIALFNFTPKGQNHAYQLFEMAKKIPETWHCEIKTADDTKALSRETLEQIKQEKLLMGETIDFFNQEYYCSFANPVEGSYYGDIIKQIEDNKQIGKIDYEPRLPVYTAWDLGLADSTAIWFFQCVGNEIRVIDYIEENNKSLDYYIREIKNKKYIYAKHFAPHDIQVREQSNGKSRIEFALQLGLRFDVVPNLGIAEGINAVRVILPKCYFNEETTRRGIKCLKNYKKDFDFKNNCFKISPKHDWSSHGADAFRYLALSYRDTLTTIGSRQFSRANDRVINF